MSKLSEKLADGPASANGGGFILKRALKAEWRALRVAEQDRAHLATIVHAPLTQAPVTQVPVTQVRPVHPPVTFARSLQPPSYK